MASEACARVPRRSLFNAVPNILADLLPLPWGTEPSPRAKARSACRIALSTVGSIECGRVGALFSLFANFLAYLATIGFTVELLNPVSSHLPEVLESKKVAASRFIIF